MAAARQGRQLCTPASRVNRFARLGSMATRVAGNMALAGIRQLGKGERPSVRELLLTPANLRRVAEQLAEGMALADEGFVPPPLPMDVLYMQRKPGGLFLLASRLCARVPLRTLIARHAALA